MAEFDWKLDEIGWNEIIFFAIVGILSAHSPGKMKIMADLVMLLKQKESLFVFWILIET